MYRFEHTDSCSGSRYIIELSDDDKAWPDLMMQFVAFLSGCGFVIDHVLAEHAINDLAEVNNSQEIKR